jgi:hypothetical protein
MTAVAGLPGGAVAPALVVDFCGERYEVREGTEFTFGRAADLSIDENRYLHRILGLIGFRDGWWWLSNVGAQLSMTVQSQVGSATITLSPGGSVPLVMGVVTVRFSAGETSYELLIEPPEHEIAVPSSPEARGDVTIDASDLPLTPDQLLLLVALCETRLLNGPSAELPSNQMIMDRFGWSTTKFNRKLDSLCVKFSRRGVGGLVGVGGKAAGNRRSSLADFVLHAGMITADQLSLLPKSGSRRNESSGV